MLATLPADVHAYNTQEAKEKAIDSLAQAKHAPELVHSSINDYLKDEELSAVQNYTAPPDSGDLAVQFPFSSEPLM